MNKDNRQDSDFSESGSKNGHHTYSSEYYKGEKQLFENESDEIDLKYLFANLLRYKFWVIGITLGCILIAFLYANWVQPVYQSTGTLLIAQEQNRYTWAGTDLSSMMQSSFGVGTGSRLTNEIQVLQSRNLADEIAGKIIEKKRMDDGSVYPILWFEYPEDSTEVSQSMLALRIQQKMNLERVDQDTDVIRISFSSYSPLEARDLVDITMETYSDLSARQKRSAANNALAFLEGEREAVQQNLANAETDLRNYMESTNLVQVDGQTEAVIERMAELESQKQQLQVQKVSVSSSIQSYEEQLEQIRPGLAEQFAENISGQLERAQFRLAELRTERSLLLQNNPALRSNPESEPQYVRLQDEIQTVRGEIQDITNNLLNADDSDVYIGFLEQEDGGVTARILELRKNLIELRIQESQLEAQERAIDQRMVQENQFFDGLPQNMLQLARLQREVQIQEQLFTTISNQYAETELWEQTQFGAGRPIDYGNLPQVPSSPNKTLYLLIGFLAGGILSVGFVVTINSMNKNIDGTEKIRGIGYPLLAVIPDFKSHIKSKYSGKEYITVQDRTISTSWSTLIDSVSPISEAYRRLHNNIIFADPDEKYQTILVTSSRKGEGKTTISTNLAVSLAETGKRVLLIDTDLRRPNIHRFTGEAREPGIAEIFYNDKSVKAAIRPTVAPGLDIITAGKSIPNPAAVIQSQKLKSLLDHLKDDYDHIVVDTPPFGVITDAAPMMKKADGVILVTRFNDTQTNELNHTVENLRRVNAHVIGTVLTAYQHRESTDYYYYGQYSYDSYRGYEEYQEK